MAIAAKIFSTLGNSQSLVPLAVKDCANGAGMTAASSVTNKDEGVDRFIDEFGSEAMAVDEGIVKNIPEYENQTFYKCRYLKDDNLCSRYESRLEVCRIFPSSPWTITPPDCGFDGWLFQEREAHKKKIRKLKEEQIFYQAKLKTQISKKEKQLYKKLIDKIDERVNLYKKYDADKW